MVRSLYFVFGILISFPCCAAIAGADNRAPNVLLLICDDLNCDLGCYGHPLVKSPNIDRLAARGLRFENAYCQYPLCGPSRASLMTGLYPDQTLIRTNPIFLRERLPNVVTLPQMLRPHDYFATRIGKIFHYAVPRHIGTSGHDDPYSWDYTINPRGRDKDEEDLIFSVRPGEFGAYLSWLAADGTDEEQTDGIAATNATELIEQYVQRGRRFFLAVGLYRPHTPYVTPKRYFEMYPTSELTIPTVPPGYLETLPPAAQKSIHKKPEHYNISHELALQAMQGYYAAISFADAQLGRILEALDRSGARDNTIIVMTSDHGYHMGEHGHWQKTTLFENAAHVPLIIAGPGVDATGQSTSSLAELVDIYPTLGELCQITPPKSLSGVSLVPVLKDPSVVVRKSAMTQLKNVNYTIRTDRYRYTEWGKDGSGGSELYDHQSDPAEMMNLAGKDDYRDVATQLSRLLRKRVTEGRRVPTGVKQIICE